MNLREKSTFILLNATEDNPTPSDRHSQENRVMKM